MQASPFRTLTVLALIGAAACAPVFPRPAPVEPVPPKPSAEAGPAPVKPVARMVLNKTVFTALPGWTVDDQSAALPALLKSCTRLLPQPPTRPIGQGLTGIGGRIVDWKPICAAAARLPKNDSVIARRFFEAWFRPFMATNNGRPEGLFTGYYEAQLRGSWKPGGRYTVPLYAKPHEMVTVNLGLFNSDLKGRSVVGRTEKGRLVPMQTRGEINGGALKGRGLELMWVDDPVEAFFLHVQGSGRVHMTDGSVVRLGFAAKNGHPYRSIGRVLIKRGVLTRHTASMASIRRWVKQNPRQGALLLAENPSYVFFRILTGDGPIGSQGAPLTAGRSLAVDRRHVPLGLPVWLDTTDPLRPKRPLRRLLIAQDTGGAIKGPVRGDFFWGYGAEAERNAGSMKQLGRYYLLLPKAAGS
ncbi:MAG: murein transglycosylase A [Rhodospirillales bacterium]|nr:murein transglycosylase A [Rhodospirillales bacterium]